MNEENNISLNQENENNNAVQEETNSAPANSSQEEKQETNVIPFKVKYNGEEKELSQEEAITYAQKGMNYDKIYDELMKTKENPILKHTDKIKEYADFCGVSVDEFIDELAEQKRRAELSQYTNKGIDEVTAKEIMDMKNQLHTQKEYIQTQKQKEQLQKEISSFREEYPDVNISDVPVEVFQIKQSENVSLSLAYKLYQLNQTIAENKSLKEKLNIKEEVANNNTLSAGSATGNSENISFDNLKPGDIKKMSAKEFEKNRDKIWKSVMK